METKLKSINTNYHTFEDNQVLTAKQLNEFLDYFEDQDRLSRVSLTGVGIVCGFKVTLNVLPGKTTIQISQGTGITTDGDLIKLQKDDKKSPGKIIGFDELEFTNFKKFEDKSAGYDFFKKKLDDTVGSKPVNMDLWEIFPESNEGSSLLKDLPDIQNKVVVLYLESYAKKADLCTAVDCDNQGIEQVSKLRVLLISEADAKLVAAAEKDPLYNKHNLFESYLSLPYVQVKRAILAGVNTSSVNQLKIIYFNAIKNGNTVVNLKDGFAKIFQIFGVEPVSATLDSLFDFNATNVPSDFQYRHELLKDLCDSYHEIRELLLHINVQCTPAFEAFPKHLLLGFVVNKAAFPVLRHRFYKSPALGNECSNLHKAKSLVERVKLQITNFLKISSGNEIKITPSKIAAELGDKAIPFYYNPVSAIRESWNFSNTENLKPELSFGYRYSNIGGNLLQFDISRYDFFRIEGHQGKDFPTAVSSISQQMKTFGLDFEFLHFNLDSQSQQFQALINNEPSVEHFAGVPRGGTFILVAANNKVVADFALNYRIKKETNGYCCPVKECSYPWISTLKYLNNLSRGLKGTASRKIPVHRNYVLQVLDYRINDTQLVNGIVTVSIPVTQILKRRIHAITDALNAKFPEGLVFDFNESQKRFTITSAKNDKYLIRFKDASLKTDTPIYEYNSMGMLKNNKLLRTNAMLCRDIIRYNNEFYKHLHTDFAPVNKDDDYGTFEDKWAEWEKLAKTLKKKDPKRVLRTLQDLPAEITILLAEIKKQLITITKNKDISCMLDGDWVNGTFVDKAILDYYRANKQTKTDQKVQFVELRKFLHNETGVTKLSVYITNMDYTAAFDAIIKQYAKSVDFYFSVPTGIYAKTI